jgi:hypothetical protein
MQLRLSFDNSHSRRPGRFGSRLALLLCGVSSALVFLTNAEAHQQLHSASKQMISFYGDLGNPINSPYNKNPLLVRPTGLALFEDGSWALEKLRWSGWGSRVARAAGISSSSNCKPNCATGKRTNLPARFTLSSPGLVLGHRVYRCFQLTIPATPSSDEHDCLKRTGKLIGYSPVSAPPSPAPKSTIVGFFSPSHNIECSMRDNGGSDAGVFCDIYSPPPGAMAALSANGHVTINRRGAGNFGEDARGFHELPYGSSKTVGRFRCTSALTGVTCVVNATGKGFFLSKQSVKRVG